MSTSCAVIILGHGTRRTPASQGFFALVDRIARRIAPIRVLPACFSCGRPTLEQQTAVLAREEVSQISIFPYFLLSGKHIAEELPQRVQGLQEIFPHIRFELLKTMEDDPLLETIVVTRLQGYVRAKEHLPSDDCCDQDILAGQFALTNKPANQYPLFRAVALATGDLTLAATMQVRGDVVRAFAESTAVKAPIFCDTHVLAAGIRAMGFAAQSIPESWEQARCFLKQYMSGAVVAVGTNALILELIMDLAKDGVRCPGLLMGLPPGLVAGSRSRKRLAVSELVHITAPGSGGGISCVLGLIQALSDQVCGKKDLPG